MQSMTEAVGTSMRILVASIRTPADLMSLASQVDGSCIILAAYACWTYTASEESSPSWSSGCQLH